jgi:thioredoxin reductase (NADPH)
MEDLVIIGTGPSGYTAALYAARANLNPLVITGSQPGGLLTTTSIVENYPGFPLGVDGTQLMTQMQQQAQRFGARLLEWEWVTETKFRPGGPHILTTSSMMGEGKVIEAKAVIISTGATHRRLGIESEDKLERRGVTYCAVCDGAMYRDVPHVVIGGGDSAMEEAMFLTKFASKVTIVHRRDEFRASKIMADRALENPKIEVAWNSVVDEILDVSAGKVTAVRLRNTQTGELSTIDAGAVFIAIGHVPNTDPFPQIDKDDDGYILLEGHSSRTNIEGVFAAGDCADHVYRQAITAAGMGCKAALDAERWLEAKR